MDNFYARSVFLVKDAEAALAFYPKTLGLPVDNKTHIRLLLECLAEEVTCHG